MPDRVNVITPEGKTISVPVDAVGPLIASDSRYRLESNTQGAARAVQQARDEELSGFGRQVEAGVRGVLRGASLGTFDAAVAAFGSPGERQLARDLRHKYGTTSAVGEIAGALLTAIPSGGTSLEVAGARAVGKQAVERIAAREAEAALVGTAERGALETVAGLTPSGLLSRGAAKIAERGAEKGVVGRLGYQALGGAVEGGVQNLGSYISDVSLGDRDLSAEGAFGAWKDGVLLGGGGAGVIGLSETALQRARALFPEAAVTREAAESGARQATDAVDALAKDSAEIGRAHV